MKIRILLLLLFSLNILESQNLSSSLTACYAFDNSVTEPISNLSATLGAVTSTVNRFNNANSAYYFSGSNSSIIQLPNDPLLKPTNAISVSAWIKPTVLPGSSGSYVLFTKNTVSSGFEAYAMTIINSGGICRFNSEKGAFGTVNFCSSTTSLVANTWYHVTMTLDNTSIKIYINGVLENTINSTVNFSYDTNKNIIFGGTNESNYNAAFTGIIDNTRFYNRILTASEVSLLYTSDPACVTTSSVTVPTAASFNAPDTLCVNQSYTLQNTSTGNVISSYWSACNSSLIASPQATNLGNPGNALNGPVFISINKDVSTYYKFVTNNSNGTIARINYGTSLNSAPGSTAIIASGLANVEGIHIDKEGSNWYGIVVGGLGSSYIARLNFGTSLSNSPTITNMGNIGGLNYPVTLLIFQENNNYYGLTINYSNNSMTRFNFGSSLSNTPSGVNLGNIGNLNGPAQMAVINYNSNWHAFICNDVNSTLTRLDFGASLNSTPTGSNIGNPNGLLNNPRGLSLSVDCNSLTGLIANRGNNILMNMDFPAGPTGTINLNSLGNVGSLNFPVSILKYRIGDSTVYYIPNAFSNSITRIDQAKCTSAPSSSTQNAIMTFSAPGNYTVSLECNEGLFDQSKYCKVINVSALPSVSVFSNPNILCKGGSATLIATGATSYSWQPINLIGATVNVNPLVSTTYSIFGSKTNGCTSTSTLNLIVSPTIAVNASCNPILVSPGNSATLSATGASTYTWNPGNLVGSPVVVNPSVATVYTVNGTSGGCSASATASVGMGLVLNITSSGNLCNNTNVTLSVSPTSTATTVLWSGPGIVGSNTSSTITVNVGGIYTVVVTDTVTSLTGTGTINVFSNSNPILLTIIPSSTVTCYPGPAVNFLVSASANLSWLPASEVSPNTGPLVSVNPSVTTTYTLIGTLGTCSSSAAITISVNPTPTVVTSVNQLSVCSLSSATISASGASDYNWIPGNLTGNTVSIIPYSPTISTVIYSVTGSNGNCTHTQTLALTVFPTPSLSTLASPPTICIGNTATLSAGGAFTYTWQSVGSPTPFPSVSVSPSLTTTYSVTGTNTLGCRSTSTLVLTVINNPAITAVASSSVICAGESVTLTASGASTYTWLPGFIFGSSIVTSPSISVTYTVNSNNSNCNYATVIVTVINCVNNSLGLTNAASTPEPSGSNYYKIRFTISAGNSSNSSLNQVSLTDNLKSTFPYPATFTVISQPKLSSVNSSISINPNFDGISDLNLTNPSASSLPANKRDTITFDVLLQPDGFIGLAKNWVIGTAIDKNNITVVDSSNNGFLSDPDADGNPTNNNEVTPIEINPLELFVPEGFSPNNDGNNDRFVISGLNGKSVSLTVFNRWGTKVYENGNYDNSWDGTANAAGVKLGSGKLPESTYYYLIQFLDGTEATLSGFLVLQY